MWSRINSSMENHQVVLYLVSLCLGAGVGIVVPQAADPAGRLSGPVLGLLLYATFLAVPFNRVARALRDWRFLTTVCAVNFLIVPLVVAILSRRVADDRALLVGVLLVLLAPCVDYVIVFTGLAGGAADRLLAATPLLMVLQMLLLPVWLLIFAGQEVIASVDVRPFLSALIWFIFVPLSAAVITQYGSDGKHRGNLSLRLAPSFAHVARAMSSLMVPLMMLTLASVVASQFGAVASHWRELLRVLPVYLAFSAVMPVIGGIASTAMKLDTSSRRAVIFSAVTRNSLVVLPLALALPAGFELSPVVVVTQTLVELLVMVTMVRLVPRWVQDDPHVNATDRASDPIPRWPGQ